MAEDGEPAKKIKDFTDVVKVKIPEIIGAVKNKSQVGQAVEELLSLEKKTRLAADQPSTVKIVAALLALLKEYGEWKLINETIALLCKRRAQLKKVVLTVIQQACTYVPDTPDKESKVALIEAIRLVSAGKMFVELERARLTRQLAEMKESEGAVAEAMELMHEVQVETIGSMDSKEKCEFLLEQTRLCISQKDFIRAEMIARKVNKKTLDKVLEEKKDEDEDVKMKEKVEEKKTDKPDIKKGAEVEKEYDFQDLKLKYNNLMITLYRHKKENLKISGCYEHIFRTPKVQADEKQWKSALESAILYLVCSPFDHEANLLLQNFKVHKMCEQLPAYKHMIDELTKEELTPWPAKYESTYKQHEAFSDGEAGKELWNAFHKVVVQHNLRVIAKYYKRITLARLSHLVALGPDESLEFLSEMVSTKQLYSRIDRPKGIISFTRKETANERLNDWSSDISKLMGLVEDTCHIINKENMMHGIKSKFA